MLAKVRAFCRRRSTELSVLLWFVAWLPILALGMPPVAARMLYSTCVIASLWVHKPIPLVVTSLLPLVLLPLLGVSPAKSVAATYMSDANVLFLGGFMVAAAVERCGLHKRLATSILLRTAGEPGRLLLGFMLATALLSAFMSNTATSAMQVPLAEGVIRRMRAARRAASGEPASSATISRSRSGHYQVEISTLKNNGDAKLAAEAETCGALPLRVGGRGNSEEVEAGTAAIEVVGDRVGMGLLGRGPLSDYHHSESSAEIHPPLPAAARGAQPHGAVGELGSPPDLKCAAHALSEAAAEATLTAKTGEDPSLDTFAKALLLGIAYSSSLGGISTLTGTGPNLVLVGQLQALFPDAPQLSFALWSAFALPLVLLLLAYTWCIFMLLGRRRSKHPGADLVIDVASLRVESQALGPLTTAERSTVTALGVTVLLWVTRHPVVCPGWDVFFRPGYVSDATVIMSTTLCLFILPGNATAQVLPAPQPGAAPLDTPQLAPRLLDWEAARSIPWDVLLLLGGGFALADGFTASGLSRLLACRLLTSAALTSMSLPLLLTLLCAFVTMATEVCSNVATCTIVLPILATVAQALQCDPRLLMIPAALASSLAFMLPVSTPPNAIAFATGRLEVRDMLLPGFALNCAGVAAIVCGMLSYGHAIFGIELDADAGPPIWSMPREHGASVAMCSDT